MQSSSQLSKINALVLEMPESILSQVRDLAMRSNASVARELWRGLELYDIFEEKQISS